ncbi:MAG TPA: ABC transporter permease [Gemmatimonadales bacterium]|jgi:simple sugar transport system permease protein|nr:ABC transporter permease [Gemmatimonadales bacterium]
MSETMAILTGFVTAAIRISTPLLLAATGELINERAGVINLGIEGAMLAGALASALGATAGGPWVGALCGIGAGLLVALVFAAVAIGARADQVITGTAITLGCVGLTGALYRTAFGSGGPGLSIPTFQPWGVPGLRRLPVLGPALFEQPVLTYLAWLLVPATGWFLFRGWWGLALRAGGESAEAAMASGVPVRRVQLLATLAGGGFAGLAGATLVLAQVGTFAEKMTAGRGFIAIAIVVLGRWRPAGVLLAALLFGAASALQFAFQAMGLRVPYQLFLVMPYLLALLALAGGAGRAGAPGGLGTRQL